MDNTKVKPPRVLYLESVGPDGVLAWRIKEGLEEQGFEVLIQHCLTVDLEFWLGVVEQTQPDAILLDILPVILSFGTPSAAEVITSTRPTVMICWDDECVEQAKKLGEVIGTPTGLGYKGQLLAAALRRALVAKSSTEVIS